MGLSPRVGNVGANTVSPSEPMGNRRSLGAASTLELLLAQAHYSHALPSTF